MFAEFSCEDAPVSGDGLEWSDLRVLLALSRAGSMVAAAKLLRVEHTTVGRRIDALEKALGVRLVGRSRTGVTLTDHGQEAVRAAEEMERAHEALTRRIAAGSEAPTGRVRVSMTDGMAGLVLSKLPALTTLYPSIEVQVQSTPVVVAIEKGEADIGLRMIAPTVPCLVSKRITEVGWSLYASEDYLARRGRPASLDSLEGHDLVGFDASLDRTPGARWLAERDRGGRVVSRANTIGALVTLLAAGQGLGVVPCFTAGGLARVTPEVLARNVLYAVVHEDHRDVPRIRVVLDFFVAALSAEHARFEGIVSRA